MTCKIIKTENGKYALFVSGKHIADYTRKSDAKRGYTRYLARTNDATQLSIFEQPANEPQAETPVNFICRVAAESLYLIEKVAAMLQPVKPQKGGVRPHTPTQRTFVRGAAGAAARSPPRLTGGDMQTQNT